VSPTYSKQHCEVSSSLIVIAKGPSLCGEHCPPSTFCQLCCSDDLKSATVEWIEMKQYHEADLDGDPCVFLDCGHIVAISSMDSQMDLGKHYDMDSAGRPVAVRSGSVPFGTDEVKVCPQCRGSLRSISRYGRIVRRALLDEATKKFISWSNSKFAGLAEKLLDEQTNLEKAAPPTAMTALLRCGEPLKLPASRAQQIARVSKWVGNNRYAAISKLWSSICSYAALVKREEQPFQRVTDYVQFARRKQQATGEFTFDDSVIQMRGYLLASALLLKCDIVILFDFADLYREAMKVRTDVSIDSSRQLADCESLIALAKKAGYTRQVVEGHLYYAQFAMLARTIGAASRPAGSSDGSDQASSDLDAIKENGLSHVEQARKIVEGHTSLRQFAAEIDDVERALLDGPFYRPVTDEEMRSVYRAMSTEFSGTGHWYTCQNGHYFTVGECGMPMEQTRCPECGAPVGGQHHRSVDGVRHAVDMEQLGEGIGMRLHM